MKVCPSTPSPNDHKMGLSRLSPPRETEYVSPRRPWWMVVVKPPDSNLRFAPGWSKLASGGLMAACAMEVCCWDAYAAAWQRAQASEPAYSLRTALPCVGHQ